MTLNGMTINNETSKMIKETAAELALALHMQRSRDISYLLKDIQLLQKQVDAVHLSLEDFKKKHETK